MKKQFLLLPLMACIVFLAVGAMNVNAQFPRTRRFSADINGASLSYTVTGIRGQTIVLIHGYPLNGDLFERQRRVLGFDNRVITVDLRGFGRSTAPNDQATIDLYAGDVSVLLTRLGIVFAAVAARIFNRQDAH